MSTSKGLPFNLPRSTLLEAIEDPEIQSLLQEESELREEKQTLREALTQLRSERAKQQVMKNQSKGQQSKNENASRLDDLHREKDLCYTELDKLKLVADEVEAARAVVRSLAGDLSVLNREVSDAEMLSRDEQRELTRLEQMEKIDPSTIQTQQERVNRYTTAFETKSKLREETEKSIAVAREKLESLQGGMTSKQIHEKFVSLRKKINDIQGQIVVLRKEQQTMREGDHAEDRAKERKLRTAMEEVDARLDHIRKTQLPVLHFQYDEAYRREIIGRAGATLLQLQLDFSVAVCIDDVEGGEGYIIGPRQNAQHCLEAIHAIVETSKAQGEQRTVVFDPSLKRQIIGAKGAKIAELERESGARLEVKDKEVILTGTKEAVEAGKALLEEFLDSFYTESLSFPPKMMSQVIGKAGATIKQVEASSGVRSLRVERESHKIVAAGAKRCVQEALRQYRELLGAAKGSTAVVHADDAMIRAVVGSKGSTVRQIEKETGARVSCEGTAITITGSPEAVEAAKAQVESHRRSEDRVSVDPVMLNFLTAEIVLKEEDGEEYLSPLEAICVATGCKVILPQRAESCVLLRGGPQNVAEAVRLLNQLLIRNIPKNFKVSYVEVLHNMLLSRPDEGSLNIIQQVQRSSPLLRVDIDRKTHSILVRSVDSEVAKTAAEELSKMVKQLADGHVRILSSIPSYKAGQLIGTRGATIREMEERTGTDIAVVKETEQIQIFHKDGDSEVLDNARQVILEFLEMHEDGDNELGTNDE